VCHLTQGQADLLWAASGFVPSSESKLMGPAPYMIQRALACARRELLERGVLPGAIETQGNARQAAQAAGDG
jgi:hypothetical protein